MKNKALEEKCKHLKREKDIMQSYLQLIADIAYDYDGFNSVEGLKGLLDEIYEYALDGRDCIDFKIIYESGNKKYNILNEEIYERGEK